MNCLRALHFAKRPVLAFGWGVRLAGAEHEARELAHLLGVPTVVTWGARDIFPHADALCAGAFGTHGVRGANLAVQYCDWFLSVGTRLDTKATGSLDSFAPYATKFMVDIDKAEIAKFGDRVTGINEDAKAFLHDALHNVRGVTDHQGSWPDFIGWQLLCSEWARRYNDRQFALDASGPINPYALVDYLGRILTPDDVIVSDTGCALAWMMQAFRFSGQRFIHAFNNTPMGYGLPAAVGAAFATGRRVVLITGDGGLAVNITELATVARHQLPIKIILFNNRGHAMCRQTQRQWLGGTYPATSYDGGLACPNYASVVRGYGIEAETAHSMDQSMELAGRTIRCDGPSMLQLDIPQDCEVQPMVRFGASLEQGDPQLSSEELAQIRREALGEEKERQAA